VVDHLDDDVGVRRSHDEADRCRLRGMATGVGPDVQDRLVEAGGLPHGPRTSVAGDVDLDLQGRVGGAPVELAPQDSWITTPSAAPPRSRR
jgi:hypothetical protein